jgi:hypothetical protein
MSADTQTSTTATAETKKKVKKQPQTVQAASPIDEKARAAGTALVELFGKTKGLPDEVAPGKDLAAKLAEGTASNADLITLRDLVNAAAAALREKDQREAAKQFSELNKGVRRAERATRG